MTNKRRHKSLTNYNRGRKRCIIHYTSQNEMNIFIPSSLYDGAADDARIIGDIVLRSNKSRPGTCTKRIITLVYAPAYHRDAACVLPSVRPSVRPFVSHCILISPGASCPYNNRERGRILPSHGRILPASAAPRGVPEILAMKSRRMARSCKVTWPWCDVILDVIAGSEWQVSGSDC